MCLKNSSSLFWTRYRIVRKGRFTTLKIHPDFIMLCIISWESSSDAGFLLIVAMNFKDISAELGTEATSSKNIWTPLARVNYRGIFSPKKRKILTCIQPNFNKLLLI